jgi:hypothetical protein
MSADWKFHVRGTFLKAELPVFPCEAIIESGDRVEGSPFRLRGVGPIAKADENGSFRGWYVTVGSVENIRKPTTVSVYVQVARGAWEPIVVTVDPIATAVRSPTEMELDLGVVRLPDHITPYEADA